MQLTLKRDHIACSKQSNAGTLTQLLRIMRLTTILMIACCVHVSAKTVSQTVTYTGKNTPLEKIFSVVKEQTGYVFFYNPDLIEKAKPVTIIADRMPLDDFLQTILQDQSLEYTFNDKTIVISRKSIIADLSPRNTSSSITPPIDVKGRVVDNNGNPILGVSVVVKGNVIGTSTDFNGNFELLNVDDNATIVITAINIETREIKLNGNGDLATVNVNLRISPLDEMQVIAYGTTSRRLNASNVSTIKAVDIEKQPVSNPLSALQGRVPGMHIVQGSGMPGSSFKVQIRGQNSIANGNDPLYIIDGVPYISQLLPNSNPAGGSPLNFINPSDIESIDILKDANATAIYGSRGANGVVLITTKKGRSGKMRVSASLYSGIAKAPQKINWLNSNEYIQMRRDAFKNDSIEPTVMNAPDLLVWDSTNFTDWQKEIIGGTSRFSDAQCSLSGGTSNLQYVFGSGYHRETTVFPMDGSDQKASMHINISNTSDNQKLRLLLYANYVADDNNLPRVDLTNYLITPPNSPNVYNTDGSLNWENSTWNNPFAFTKQQYKSKTKNLISNASLSYEILKSLSFKSNFGYNNLSINEISTEPISSQNPALLPKGNSSFVTNEIRSWIIEPQVVFNPSLRKAKFEFLLGGSFQQTKSDGQYLLASGFTNDIQLENLQAAPTLKVFSLTSSEYKYSAAFGRFNVNLKDRYIFTASARRDGTSRFGPNKRFHNFGAGGFSWIFSNEPIAKKNIRFLSYGKLRASYGTSGNDQVGDYRYFDLYNTSPFTYQNSTGLTPVGIANPELAWEETKKLDAGIELGFFKERILLNAGYYKNLSSNQLVNYNLSAVTGFRSMSSNLPAKVENKGWELSLSSVNINVKNVIWKTNINLSVPKNKLVSFPNISVSPYKDILIVGKPVDILQVFQFAKIDQETGVYLFSNDQDSLTSTPSFLTDRKFIVTTAPKYYGGLQNTITFKSFEIDFLIHFVKQTGSNYLFQSSLPPGSFGNNRTVDVLPGLQKPGEPLRLEKLTQSSYSPAGMSYSNAISSSLAYVDASFIRLKNVSISYEFPLHIKEKLKVSKLSAFVQGQNLLTISNYKGIDPETQNLKILPPLKVVTTGVRLGF